MLRHTMVSLLDNVYPSAGTVEESSFRQRHLAVEASLPPSPSASVSAAIYPDPLFAIRPVPGKGLGLIANRSISAGTLIHSEAPLIHLNNSEVGYYRLEWEIQRLSPFEKAIYTSFHHAGMDELPPILEIWRKNSFPSGDDAQAVYSTISRLNNSCTPNAFLSWDFSRKTMNLFAVRDIDPGEEICVSYVNTLLERNMRHDFMQEIWEFSCRCEACELEGEELEESNERRWKVKRAIQDLSESSISLQDVLMEVQEALQLLKEESLPQEMPTLSWFAYQHLMRHGRAEEAKSYARLAYEHAKLAYGESHCITLLAARGMVEPMLHSEERRTGWLHELGMGNVACIVS